jgi:hypothetical protein
LPRQEPGEARDRCGLISRPVGERRPGWAAFGASEALSICRAGSRGARAGSGLISRSVGERAHVLGSVRCVRGIEHLPRLVPGEARDRCGLISRSAVEPLDVPGPRAVYPTH